MTRRRWLRVPLLLFAWTVISAATPDDEAIRLFDRGDYLKAASVAASKETAPCLALAARAILTHAIYVADGTQRVREAQRAEVFARKALSIDPDHVEAHLQLVIALYHQARADTPISAYFQGYAAEARFHLDTALRIDPNNPWAHSLLGGWHFEIVRLAGTTMAYLLLEADLEAGRSAFDKAMALMPNNIVLQYEFARTLLLSDPESNRAMAIAALEAVLAETPAGHLESLMAGRAQTTLDAVRSGSEERLQRILNPDL